MKITVYAWHHSEIENTAIEKAGFKHNEPVEVEDVFLAVQKLYAEGDTVNVAILRSNRKGVTIGVSDDLFRQR